MFERNIFDEYKLYCEQRFVLGDHEGFIAQNKHYFLVCVDEIEDHEITEMIKMGNHLTAAGDNEIAPYIPTVANGLTSFVEGQNCVLFQLPQYVSRSKKQKSIGTELARFHNRGKTYPAGKKETGTWSQFWINRLTQLENLYVDLSKQKRKLSFDQAFMVSFPYYLGRTENAIQYFVDTNLDYEHQRVVEPKTICHYQFQTSSWLTFDERTAAGVKSPIEFTYDYPSRDIAEWIRGLVIQEDNPYPKIKEFIKDYSAVETISPLAWRYIYSRLLFPINYFRIVEGYYRSVDDDEGDYYTEQLFDLFQREANTEVFLRGFHEKVVPDQWRANLPTVEWLGEFRPRVTNTIQNPFSRRQ